MLLHGNHLAILIEPHSQQQGLFKEELLCYLNHRTDSSMLKPCPLTANKEKESQVTFQYKVTALLLT